MASTDVRATGLSVLVADDDIAFARLLSELLTERGYRTDTANDHAQALDHLSHTRYAVAVVDLVMPGGGGLDLADRIRSASPDTQVLILTGQGSLPSAIAGIRRGVFDYLQKAEVDLEKLGRAVGSAAERWKLLQENRQLLAGLQDTNARLQSLHAAALRLAATEHFDRILQELVSSARTLLGVERARVLLFDRGHDGALRTQHAAGDGAGVLVGARLHPEEGLAAVAASTGRVQRVENAAAHPQFSPRIDDLGAGSPGFMAVPVRHGPVMGSLAVGGRVAPLGEQDEQLAASLAVQAATALDNALKNERAVNFFTHTCNILVSFLESKDVHLPGHSRAVAALADMVTRRLGLPDDERRVIHFAALLHDIGKVRLEPELLRSDQALTQEQVLRMREHASLGVELLKPITLWEDILPLIQTHHERWDGNGYPSGLAGEDIPLGARVIAVAEAFDAMTRVYPGRAARSTEEGLAELQAFAGTQFDPRIVRLFVAEYRENAPS